jgi:hypothetical protein
MASPTFLARTAGARHTLSWMPEKNLQKQLRDMAEELTTFRDHMRRCLDGLPKSAQETGPQDIHRPDEITRVRSTLECILADHLDIALADLLGLTRSLTPQSSSRKQLS